jgi:hypothetical protein
MGVGGACLDYELKTRADNWEIVDFRLKTWLSDARRSQDG